VFGIASTMLATPRAPAGIRPAQSSSYMRVRLRQADEHRGELLIRLFGPLSVEDGPRLLGPRDLGGSRPKHVLEILLAGRGRRGPPDPLADLLGGDEPPKNAAGSLQTFVSVLRRH